MRRQAGEREHEGNPREGPAIWREGQLQGRLGGRWMERTGAGAVAGQVARSDVAAMVRQAGRLYGTRRHDPVYGDARREVSRGAVPDHGRAGTALERARPQRVSAYPV